MMNRWLHLSGKREAGVVQNENPGTPPPIGVNSEDLHSRVFTRTIIGCAMALSTAILRAVAATDLSGLRLEGPYTYDYQFDRSALESAGIATHIQGAFSVSIQETSWIASYKSTSVAVDGVPWGLEVDVFSPEG